MTSFRSAWAWARASLEAASLKTRATKSRREGGQFFELTAAPAGFGGAAGATTGT